MDSAMMCRILASAGLLLALLWDPTEACFCARSHPQTQYCKADVVIRSKFVKGSKDPTIFEIQTTQVYKGSEAMQELRTLHAVPSKAHVFMLPQCFLKPRKGEDYVIAGKRDGNVIKVEYCSFVKPWAELSPEQQSGISQNYRKGCRCPIRPCFRFTCFDKSKCRWDLRSKGREVLNKTCLPEAGTPPRCSWQSLSS
ncbi:hypothetical protein lerEdw1_010255 [Lerista edwardsae]|nr:hypothetical protein lerEdw1_010255 [Lerista edwardsae]